MNSFDVFETVLLRVVGKPCSLFLFVGQVGAREGILSFSAELFRDMRVEAEREAYRRFGYPDLDAIYTVLGSLAGLEERELGMLKELELKLEREWSRVNPVFAEKVEASRLVNDRVLFLSDMYLPKSFLESNLREKGLLRESDRLYLSNNERLGKGDGQLFSQVLEREGIRASGLRHHGNCLHADVKAPSEMGISVEHYDDGNLSAWERFLESLSAGSDGLSSLWAGASRRARCALGDECGDSFERTLRHTAVSVAGPLLVTFVHWCLVKAREDGTRQLVFVARDGEILFKVAQVLKAADQGFQDISLKYVYGSRQAWRPASLMKLGDFERAWILEGGHEISRDKVVARLGLDLAYGEILPISSDLDEIWAAVLQKLQEPALKQAEVKRELVLEYLKQEELLDDHTGYVEIGCTGLTMAALEQVLELAGAAVPKTYFFGLSPESTVSAPSDASTFFYNALDGTGFSPSLDFNFFVLLEMFCAATHGRTTGYLREGGKVVPRLESPQCYWERDNGVVKRFQEGVLSFAGSFADSPLMQMNPIRALPLCAKVIRKFWQEPSLQEAEVWGSYIKEHDQSGLDGLEMGPKLSAGDLVRCVQTQGLPNSWWPAATDVRTSQGVRGLLDMGSRLGGGLAQSKIVLGGLKNCLLGK